MYKRLTGRLKVASSGGSRSLLTLNDLTWNGYYRVPSSGPGGSGGNATYAGYVMAIRYVGGERRYLIPHYTDSAGNGRIWGDIVEYADPATAKYTGATPSSANALVERRRWAADWTLFDADADYDVSDAGGARMGWMYWDETHGVLWYTTYGYYLGSNIPYLGATQLTDTSAGGGYYTVGTKYGPWWYRSNSTAGSPYWKQINFFGHYPIPSSAQSDLGGRKLLLGGGVGASHSLGHWGPGLTAFSDLPSLGDAANSTIAVGTKIADYSNENSPVTPIPNARRDGNYSVLNYADHYLESTFGTPVGGLGWWMGSIDRMAGWCWAETSTKHGIVIFAAHGTGRATYGDNPISRTPMEVLSLTRSGTTATLTMYVVGGSTVPFTTGDSVTISNGNPTGWNGTYTVTQTGASTFTFTVSNTLTTPATRLDGSIPVLAQGWNTGILPDIVDPTRANPEAQHGYSTEGFDGAVFVFDPSEVREVGLGTRQPYSNGINPHYLGDWHAQWPNLPINQGLNTGATVTRLIGDNIGSRVVWDATAQQIIWTQPASVNSDGSGCTINFFSIA